MRRHRGHTIERDVCTGDYRVVRYGTSPGDRTVVMSRPSHWGFAQTIADLDAQLDAELFEQRKADRRAERARLAELAALERERLWLRRMPGSHCPLCGDLRCDVETDDGRPLRLDTDPSSDGVWVVHALRVADRRPLIRRAHAEDGERWQLHSATCRRRPPMVDRTGQARLRFPSNTRPPRPKRERKPRPPRQLALTVRAAEQLDLIPCASPNAAAAPPSGGR